MHMHSLGYALLCVAIPAGWGLLVYGATRLIERRLRSSTPESTAQEKEPQVPLDYHI